ncbi:hypothetical protein [Intestinibacter bartlettii]|uniref:hypothetical protein n=1 Tax=Intestinibacter bartlettii TaxID=261299 RepID=UPI0006C48714|nr:hypothetical protein [Intestinibacter bartlettii]MCC2706714.1 hypothetical protein [Intestinibacter bartlettii]MCC2762163.1 hypothetical protein [Intestinibacter bartlettii]MDU6472588.1 hypothetical protein [Intestinibacter bartlettii]CUO61845.1 Uncharacterised protein [Intestinibacter bartlettii]
MGLFDDILDWAADKVQTVTGEKERRRLVSEFKDVYDEFKTDVEIKISDINRIISEFNRNIRKINNVRKTDVEKNIVLLSNFLGKFGKVKSIGEYYMEKESNMLVLPEHKFEMKESYINEIDWSKDDVFQDTFFLTPIGMTIKTKEQNLSINEKLNQLRLEAEETLNQLKIKEYAAEQDRVIANLYIDCIEIITNYIKEVIIPELKVVESFFQVLKIKNEVISGNSLQEIKFSNDIELLRDTQYEKHFLFVKNAFMFYVISCKIYNTPVLTRLLNNKTEKQDIDLLEKDKKLLLEHKKVVGGNLMFVRGEQHA